jgi:hypothetical protein
MNKDLPLRVKSKTKIVTPLLVLSLVLGVAIAGNTMLPIQTLNAQMAVQIGGPDLDQVSKKIIGTLLVPGFSDKYNLTMNGNTIPINYSILDGSLVGILSDMPRKSLDLAVDPQANGGALEVNLPRDLIDSKNAAGQDTDFIVKIDGTRVSGEPSGICVGDCPNILNTFKETYNTGTDRVLTITFGPESRFIEIIGNKTSM